MSLTDKNNQQYGFIKPLVLINLTIPVSFLLYIYYHQLDLEKAYLTHYIMPFIGVVFWVIVMQLKEKVQANIVLMIMPLVVGIYTIEIGLIFLDYHIENRHFMASKAGIDFDNRTKLEVIADFSKKDIHAVPALRPALFVDSIGLNKKDVGSLYPLSGISNKVTIGENETGNFAIYQSDRYGFNNPDYEWDAKKVSWILTGDSFAEGRAVNTGEDIAGVIRSITNDSVINLGRSGNGPLLELAALKEYGQIKDSEKVLWIYYEENDMIDLSNEKSNPLLMQYMKNDFSQNLANRQNEVDKALSSYLEKNKKNKGKNNFKLSIYKHKTAWVRLKTIISLVKNIINPSTELKIDPLFNKVLLNAKSEVDKSGGTLYFIYLPEYGRYKSHFISHNDYRKKSKVLDIVRSLDIPIIDIHEEVFKIHQDPLSLFPFRSYGHYNADGYAKVAKAIIDSIK